MTQAAFDWLPGIESEALEQPQREHAAISEPWCWISGDPNPRNWGLRADGTPVLFDWELFGPGTPATDLAIIVPGLGTLTDYKQNRFYTWFVGFAPADAPEVAISTLVVNTPEWQIKAPQLAREVLRAYFEKKGLSPQTLAVAEP